MIGIRYLVGASVLATQQMAALAAPTQPLFITGRDTVGEPQIQKDFPDPSILQDTDKTWYSFATNSNGKTVQAARAPKPQGPWTWLDVDLLPDGGWTSGKNTWAPDIRIVDDGTYVMYYSGEVVDGGGRHCIGVATSDTILGPYAAKAEPFACPFDKGGAIDPAGFYDVPTKKRYVVYKVDGNNIGHGGDCNNGVEPLVSTPLVLQEVEADGITKVGSSVQILDRTTADGPLVEAPNLVFTDEGAYILFFSSFCFTSVNYNVNYAVSRSLTGPYKRAERPLLKTGDFGLESPGGATSVDGGKQMLFHANCPEGRCLYAANYTVTGTDVIVS